MEFYTFPQQQGYTDTYTVPAMHSNSSFTREDMYGEGAPEYYLDPTSMYYPTATPTDYGYVYTGYESAGKWDNLNTNFSFDAGAQTDSYPLYYPPSIEYGDDSLYNPYNPYIPGAMAGVGQYLSTPQYYAVPSYDSSESSSAYYTVPVHSRPGTTGSSITSSSISSNSLIANRAKGSVMKHNLSSGSAFSSPPIWSAATSKANSFTKASSGAERSPMNRKQPSEHAKSAMAHPTSNHILQGGGTQPRDYVPYGKPSTNHALLKASLPQSNGLSTSGSQIHGQQHTGSKLPSKFLAEKVLKGTKVAADALTEQNQGPKSDNKRNHLTLKAYSSAAGNADAHGNITIFTDQYNKDNLKLDYINARFFVIKSYSEDDVHKSIKYGVWSSTANGNRKLNNAYEDAQRTANQDSGSCPIFLFFSVNASGQFCGVAEMTGPVDFHRDMNFWQQDKWSGCFPVKWHIVKDVPNPIFRNIILENNEFKPVTNSRDTQEVRYRKGIDVLRLCKNYVSKTSLFDDFFYYENREKTLLQEKARLLAGNYSYPFYVSVLDYPNNSVPSNGVIKSEQKDSVNSDKGAAASSETVSLSAETGSVADKDESASVGMASLEGNAGSYISACDVNALAPDGERSIDDSVPDVASLTLSPKQSESEVNPVSTEVMSTGSMPVKVNGCEDAAGFLQFGTIDETAFKQVTASASSSSSVDGDK